MSYRYNLTSKLTYFLRNLLYAVPKQSFPLHLSAWHCYPRYLSCGENGTDYRTYTYPVWRSDKWQYKQSYGLMLPRWYLRRFYFPAHAYTGNCSPRDKCHSWSTCNEHVMIYDKEYRIEHARCTQERPSRFEMRFVTTEISAGVSIFILLCSSVSIERCCSTTCVRG